MKLLYIANQRLPTEKAYGLQIAKMCEAFADNGIKVRLLMPTRKNQIQDDVFKYYNIKRNFEIKKIYSPDFYLPGKLDRAAFWGKNLISAIILSARSFSEKFDLIYVRDELSAYLLSYFKKNIFFEAHRFSGSKKFFYKRFKKTGLKIVTISGGLKNEFARFGFKPENILVAHDGVDLKEFDVKQTKAESRTKLGLPQDKKIIGYVGQLKTFGMEKGVGDLIKAFNIVKTNHPDALLVIVGGEGRVLEDYKTFASGQNIGENEILFVGQKRHELIPFYLRAFDVLAMPFPYNTHYAFYMSPLKLFEYMASERPIAASDLPSVREVLNFKNSVLVKPDNPTELAIGIKKILDNESYSRQLAEVAFADVLNYTWQKRAQNILNFIKV